jgi:hypothetical protein
METAHQLLARAAGAISLAIVRRRVRPAQLDEIISWVEQGLEELRKMRKK